MMPIRTVSSKLVDASVLDSAGAWPGVYGHSGVFEDNHRPFRAVRDAAGAGPLRPEVHCGFPVISEP